jgi:hypothetical protein
MPVTIDALNIDLLGHVPATYRHEWRVAEPREPIALPHAIFKWYHVRREGVSVPDVLDEEARDLLYEAGTRGDWDMQYGLNFALLHVSTAYTFLIAGVWRGHQELWERIYVKELATDGPFTEIDRSGVDAPAACVWELGVICHERMVWHRYLFSPRDNAGKLAWLADTFSGQV